VLCRLCHGGLSPTVWTELWQQHRAQKPCAAVSGCCCCAVAAALALLFGPKQSMAYSAMRDAAVAAQVSLHGLCRPYQGLYSREDACHTVGITTGDLQE
jgi:hypothetical protein